MSKVETVKVVSEGLESGFVLINKSDFDDKKHKLFSEKPAPKAEPKKSSK